MKDCYVGWFLLRQPAEGDLCLLPMTLTMTLNSTDPRITSGFPVRYRYQLQVPARCHAMDYHASA